MTHSIQSAPSVYTCLALGISVRWSAWLSCLVLCGLVVGSLDGGRERHTGLRTGSDSALGVGFLCALCVVSVECGFKGAGISPLVPRVLPPLKDPVWFCFCHTWFAVGVWAGSFPLQKDPGAWVSWESLFPGGPWLPACLTALRALHVLSPDIAEPFSVEPGMLAWPGGGGGVDLTEGPGCSLAPSLL